ncbi:DUF4035 domain-containing protein [uncultured Thermomonospora sp.]|uniref:phage tail assembly protein T n=1 Tax=uncultured Thermomonospora sp. TaxID=671175 RepID=UPI00259B9C46|nr:DUF4035 domain-containing protein [uncultured Thermomonospora sp.]
MPVSELLARMPSAELTEWMAYERITGPLGGERGDIQAALISTVIANSLAGKKGRRAKLRDFLLKWDRKPQSWRDQLAVVRQLNRMFGGVDRTKGTADGDSR